MVKRYYEGYHRTKTSRKYIVVQYSIQEAKLIGYFYKTLKEAKVAISKRIRRTKCPYSIFELTGERWHIE